MLSEQNRQLLSMLEQEESKGRQKLEEVTVQKEINAQLRELKVKFEKMKAAGRGSSFMQMQ